MYRWSVQSVHVTPHLIWETQSESLFQVDLEWSSKMLADNITQKFTCTLFYFFLSTSKQASHVSLHCFIPIFNLQKIYYCIVYQVYVFVKEVTHLDFFNVLCSLYAESVGVTKHQGWVEHGWIPFSMQKTYKLRENPLSQISKSHVCYWC